MKKTKRITSFMLVITFTLSIAGCKLKSDASASQQQSATQLTTKATTTVPTTDNTTVSTEPMTVNTTNQTTPMIANTIVQTEPITTVPATMVPPTTVNPFDSEDSEATTLATEVTSEDEDEEEESTVSEEDDESNQDTYIQVNIANQTLQYFKDGEIVLNSSVVTGMKNVTPTPTGEYAIIYKAMDVTLTGDDYSSHVDYWISFLGSGYGFHDASWRVDFGGDIYTYDGSHGCVNMPLEAVAYLYELVEIGTPVFIE